MRMSNTILWSLLYATAFLFGYAVAAHSEPLKECRLIPNTNAYQGDCVSPDLNRSDVNERDTREATGPKDGRDRNIGVGRDKPEPPDRESRRGSGKPGNPSDGPSGGPSGGPSDDGGSNGKSKGNASANNGKGGNYDKTGHSDNGKGKGRFK